MTDLEQTIDQNAVEAFVEQALGVLVGAGTAQLAHLGDRLGLYRSLAGDGPATPAELARRTSCAERYLAEWLAQQTSAGFLAYDADSGRFLLPAEHAVVLAAEDSPVALAGAFEAMTGWQLALDELATAFRTGRGIGWGQHDQRVRRGTARFFGAAYRHGLVGEWVPALGLEAVLREGALVADVGCGQGLSTLLLAEAFPSSRFVGIDTHAPSLEAARRHAEETGVSERVSFQQADASSYDGGPYDVIWFFDCLHDLGDPVGAVANARRHLAAEGTVALVEPFARDELADNLRTNPGAGLHYTASTFLCLPHSLSEHGRAGLGGQAGGRRLAEALAAGGLTRAERVATTPIHAVYSARP